MTDIPAFGIEAEAAERLKAEEALRAYLDATGTGAWSRACGKLASIAVAQLQELIVRARAIEKKTCGEGLRLALGLIRREEKGKLYHGVAPVAALRIKKGGTAGGGAGFALFHGRDGRDYYIAMRLENGEWRIGTLTPAPLG